eukprot:COSAG02_NODE_14631_length_1252_cov_9.076240_4_plen_63_part_01
MAEIDEDGELLRTYLAIRELLLFWCAWRWSDLHAMCSACGDAHEVAAWRDAGFSHGTPKPCAG